LIGSGLLLRIQSFAEQEGIGHFANALAGAAAFLLEDESSACFLDAQ
jgi:hypothetical protein